MLGRVYKAELSKIFKRKGIYIALALIIVLVIFIGIFASVFNDVLGMGESITNRIGDIIVNTPREEFGTMADRIEEQLLQKDGESSTVINRFVDEKGMALTLMSVLRYLDAHPEIDVRDVVIPNTGMFGIAENVYNFMLNAVKLVTELVIFYAVITMSGILASEYREGIMRMELLRRNSRSSVLTAKWLAVFTTSAMLLLVGFVASALFGAFKFKMVSKSVLCVIANTNVLIMNEFAFMLLQLIFSLIAIFVMIQFSSFMCTISRYNRAGSMAIPIIVLMVGNLSAYLLQVMWLGVIDLSNSLDLTAFLVPDAMTMPNVSLYSAIPVLIVYTTIFMSTSYYKFKHAEL